MLVDTGLLCVARLRSTKSPTRLAGSEGASGRRGIGTGEPIPSEGFSKTRATLKAPR